MLESMNVMNIYRLVGIGLLAINAACTPKPPACANHFAGGEPPSITNQSLAAKTEMLCFEGYATMHSGISRTPVWSAEHLTADRVDTAKGLKRKNTFHAEQQLPASERAELNDYAHSGFDRGHMAPSGDMPTEIAQHESFSLANMIPQNPKNNQILWEGIEEATRSLARSDGEVYVVTGPIFAGSSLQRVNGRVLVPTAVFKAIYDPARKEAGAYVTPNGPGMEYETLSIADLEKRVGINLFPKLPAQIKDAKMEMPTPTPHGPRRSRNKPIDVTPEVAPEVAPSTR
jgi:endonuclease G, mitochondrial